MSLFDYPKKAHFGRVLPKNKIYEYAGANTKLKELFVRQIDQIVWKYKLAPETINVPATKAVTEIQVFEVRLKTKELKEEILRAIDKAISFPILYEVSNGTKVKIIGCYKRPSDSDSGKWVVGSYFATDWIDASITRQTLPVKLDLAALYEALLGSLIPYPPRNAETLPELVERAEAIARYQKELAKVYATMNKEKQFNRKVEFNGRIRSIEKQIEDLKDTSGK